MLTYILILAHIFYENSFNVFYKYSIFQMRNTLTKENICQIYCNMKTVMYCKLFMKYMEDQFLMMYSIISTHPATVLPVRTGIPRAVRTVSPSALP